MRKYRKSIDMDLAIKLYSIHENVSEVARLLNCNDTTLGIRLKDFNIHVKKSKYKGFDEYYFHNIDTEAKAYFFGLLLADGNNYTKAHRIILSLSEVDVAIIEVFKKELNIGVPIKLNKTKDENHKDRKYLQVNSKVMSQELSKKGCVNAKSNILEYPYGVIPEHLENHFIRGIFDGDGSISTFYANNCLTSCFNITGNAPFLEEIKKVLVKNCNIFNVKLNKPKRYLNGTAMLSYGGNVNSLKIKDYLYKDATIFLERKKEKFDSIVSKRYKSIT